MNGDNVRSIVAEIIYRRARRVRQARSLPLLVAVYLDRRSDTRTLDRPRIEQVHFALDGDELPIPLGIRGLAILDVLVRYKPATLSAAQIEKIVQTDPISRRLGPLRLMKRRVIKVYMWRIRMRLATVLVKRGIFMDPHLLLITECTEVMNVKAYRLGMPCKITYQDAAFRGR